MLKTTTLILSFFLIVSCNKDINKDNEFQSSPITFTEIGKGHLGGAEEIIPQSNLVITNQTDWQNLMTKMDMINKETSRFSETNIDFENYLVIAVFLRIQSSCGTKSFEIVNIIENENSINVSTKDVSYGENVVNAFCQPFHIVKIPKSDKTIVFEPTKTIVFEYL